MANRAASPKLPSSSASSETSADERFAQAMKALKERHKEAKQQLKLQRALELAEEQAEAKRQEDRRDYLIGHSVRSDRSEAGVAFVLAHAERMTHPSDRKLFGLAPLAEGGNADAGTPAEKIEKWDQRGGVEDAPSPMAIDEIPGPSDAEEREERSEQDPLPGTLTVVSGSLSGRHARGSEEAVDEKLGDVPHRVGTDDAVTSESDEPDGFGSADLGEKDRHADAGRNEGESSSSSPIPTPQDVDSRDEDTRAQATPSTAEAAASGDGSEIPSSFKPRLFLSQANLRVQIDDTGAKRARAADGQWVATAVTPEQAESLVALKLQPYEPK